MKRGRAGRREMATGRRVAAASVRARGDQDLLEGLELLEALATADGDRMQRILGDDDRHPGLRIETNVDAVQEGPAPSKDDALLHDVRRQLRRRLVQRH